VSTVRSRCDSGRRGAIEIQWADRVSLTLTPAPRYMKAVDRINEWTTSAFLVPGSEYPRQRPLLQGLQRVPADAA
jgi:hypothetical protein